MIRRQKELQQMKIITEYPFNKYWDFFTTVEKINMDEERIKDIKSGKGFPITAPKGIKKDVKNQDGIFSSRYGSNSVQDIDPYSNRYRCKCGLKHGSMYNGELCEYCNTRVTYVDDDVSITGYLILKDKYWIIQPALYSALEAFIGADRLAGIIEPKIEVDSNGNELPVISTKKDEPFKGIGLLEFKDRFDEVMNFYLSKYPQKKHYYESIMGDRDKVWTHSIAVYSSLLRPSKLDNGSLKYEDCNDQFNMLASLVYKCNDDKLAIDQKPKERLQLLYDIQYNINVLYNKLIDILKGKKGDIRSAIGGKILPLYNSNIID